MAEAQTARDRSRFRTADLAARTEFADAVLEGLSGDPKTLPCRFFYDDRGSALFEEITRLPEYYPTRTEVQILHAHAGEMVAGFAERETVLVEPGSGSSTKTELLLRAMPRIAAYVPVDVSRAALEQAAARLASDAPELPVHPVVGDFTRMSALRLPDDIDGLPRLGFFPGSTIGNLETEEAVLLLRQFGRLLGPGGELLLGTDLIKDEVTLVRAYNDAAGVTAAFNLNVLVRINRTFGPAFDLERFRHRAIWNSDRKRIEMHLVSLCEQTVTLFGQTFRFAAGETIHTESSHKYEREEVVELAAASGWHVQAVWTDPRDWFAVFRLCQHD